LDYDKYTENHEHLYDINMTKQKRDSQLAAPTHYEKTES